MWTNTNGLTTPDFKYLNAYYLASAAKTNGAGYGNLQPLSLFVNGQQSQGMPEIDREFTYAGNFWLDSRKPCCKYVDRESTRGRLILKAHLGASTIRGLMDELEFRKNASGTFNAVANSTFVISDGTIDRVKFSADLVGTGGWPTFVVKCPVRSTVLWRLKLGE